MKGGQRIDVFSDVGVATRALSRKSAPLKLAVKAIGAPHIRRRAGGFEGLFRIIVEQQVSVPSAQAIWKRCLEGAPCASAAAIARLDETALKSFGLSTPKARYVLGLARAAESGALDFTALGQADDKAAMEMLVALKGVGPWTASIYLLFCEGRVDVWPPNDVALKHAFNAARGEEVPVEQKALDAAAAEWAPWRGVAAHVLWTYYAHLRGRTPI